MNATRRDLEIQFKRSRDNGWLEITQAEAKREGTTTAHKLARQSRETNLKNIRGDFRGGIYHGYGIEQVDIGTDPAYCKAWTPSNVKGGIEGGTKIYLSKVRDTLACVGKRVAVRSKFFVGKAVEADDLRRIATAAYNCGRWAHYHFSRGENVDSTTTGDDYSRDVYDRAVEFADILEKAGIESGAVARELELQGKYARREHRLRFGIDGSAPRVKAAHGPAMESQDEVDAVVYEREESHDTESATAPSGESERETSTSTSEQTRPDNSAVSGSSDGQSPAPPSFETIKQQVPNMKRAWTWLGSLTAGGFFSTVMAAFNGLNPWLVLLIGFMTGLVAAILGVIVFQHRKQFWGFMCSVLANNQDPTTPNVEVEVK